MNLGLEVRHEEVASGIVSPIERKEDTDAERLEPNRQMTGDGQPARVTVADRKSSSARVEPEDLDNSAYASPASWDPNPDYPG